MRTNLGKMIIFVRINNVPHMTLSEAINIFLQMSLKTGGLPFEVNRNPPIVLDNRMFDYLNAEYQKGLASAKEEKDWVPLDEVKKRYGKN